MSSSRNCSSSCKTKASCRTKATRYFSARWFLSSSRIRRGFLLISSGSFDPRSLAELPPRWEEVAKVVAAMDAAVKVFCVHTEPNFSLPWQCKRQYSSSSSGFITGERRVLTNAHSVEHYTQVKLKKRGSDTKYLAMVLVEENDEVLIAGFCRKGHAVGDIPGSGSRL